MKPKFSSKMPPMGWNSYDYYDTTVTEADVKRNAQYMAEHLRLFGYEYVVVDIQWYAHDAGSKRTQYQYIPFSHLEMDEYSRLLPDPTRFPSSVNGAGFAPLAAYVHELGLKFGIHIMRGIPRVAAQNHGKIAGCDATADEIADPSSICGWNPDMYGVRNTPAGQCYYDSLIQLYASWGVDFIKCDDICNTNLYSNQFSGKGEIEMLSRAIDKIDAPMVLSLSPGPALVEQAWFYQSHGNMWRITDDFWDDWNLLKAMFLRCEQWQDHVGPGSYPDCDMLPLGVLGKGFGKERPCNFSPEEQKTMMTLWCMFSSPLMIGSELSKLDEETLNLLTNKELLQVLSPDYHPHQIFRDEDKAAWQASNDDRTYIALFNLSDAQQEVSVSTTSLLAKQEDGIRISQVHDLWSKEDIAVPGDKISAVLPPHGCKAYLCQKSEKPVLSPTDMAEGLYCLGTIDIKAAGHGKGLLGDINGDGRMEVVFVQGSSGFDDRYYPHQASCITAYSMDGKLLWQTGTPLTQPGNFGADFPAQIYDIDEDGIPEILCVMDHEFKVLDGHDGSLKYSFDLPSEYAHDCIVIANFSGNKHATDILLKDRYHQAWAVDKNGKLLWTHKGNTGHFPWPYDINGDGFDEVMIGYDMVDHEGNVLWSCNDLDDHADCLWVGDVNGDGKPEMAVGGSVTVLYSMDGTELWRWADSIESQHIALGHFLPEEPGLQMAGLDRIERGDGYKGQWGGRDGMFLVSCDGKTIWKENRTTKGWLTIVNTYSNWNGSGADYILAYRRGGGILPTLYDGHQNPVVTFPVDGYVIHGDFFGRGIEDAIVYTKDTAYIFSGTPYDVTSAPSGTPLPQPKALYLSTLYPGGEYESKKTPDKD